VAASTKLTWRFNEHASRNNTFKEGIVNITSAKSRALWLAVSVASFCPSLTYADGRFGDARLMVGKQQIAGMLISDTNAKQLSFDANGSLPFQIGFDKIRSLTYERASQPRYAAGLLIAWPLLFTKSKQHYLTVQYTDGAGGGKFQIVRLDKNNAQAALNTIEADTGIKIERTEER
jgi:hypothetical protein